jgi:thioredoxin-like negative regulator of GroEL
MRVRHWLETRNHWRLLAAPPFLAALIVAATCLIVVAGWRPALAAAKMRDAAAAAYQAGDYRTAAVGYRSLLVLQDAGDQEYRLRLARCQLALGGWEEGRALLHRLAPLTQPGYGPAHFQLAMALLSGTNTSPQALATAERHLTYVLKLDPSNAEAHEMLGRVSFTLGHLEQSKKHLLEAAQSRNSALMPLARTLRALGEETAARQYADRAQRHFRSELDRPKPGSLELRLQLADSLCFLGEFNAAFNLLETSPRFGPPASKRKNHCLRARCFGCCGRDCCAPPTISRCWRSW